MRNKKILLFLLPLLFSFGLSARLTKNRSLFYTEEKINGITFTHRIELFEGREKNIYKVNGKSVEEELYEEKILEAEKEERRRARKKEKEEKLKNHFFKQKMEELLIKKITNKEAQIIKDEIKKLEQYELDVYFAFSKRKSNPTILDRSDYDYLLYDLIPRVDKIIGNGDELDYSELLLMQEEIQKYLPRVLQLRRDTISRAIEECDDTKLLKKLLILVSNS